MGKVKGFVEKNSKILQISITNLLVVNLLLVIFSTGFDLTIFNPKNLLFSFLILLSVLFSLRCLLDKNKRKYLKIAEAIFFSGIIFEIILFFYPEISFRFLSLPTFPFQSLQTYIFILTMFSLLMLIFNTKKQIEKKKSKKMSKYVLLILIISILTASLIQYYLIGKYYFWTDEVYTLNALKMILKKGGPLYDSGLFYGRASIYHYINAYASSILGLNEVGTRIINIVSAVFTSLLVFLVVKKKSFFLSLIGAFLVMISSLTIASVIETRFYSFFTLFFFLTSISFYFGFLDEKNLKNKLCVGKLSVKYNVKWLIVFLISLFITYNTHQFFFLFIVGLLIYSVLSFIMSGFTLKNILLFVGSLLLIFFGAYYRSGTFDIYYAFFREDVMAWASHVPKNPPYYFNLLSDRIVFLNMFIVSCLSIGFLKRKQFLIYLFSIITGGLLFISFQNALQERYVFFVTPLLFTLVILNIYYLWQMFRQSLTGKIAVVFITTLIMLTPLLNLGDRLGVIDYPKDYISYHKELDFYDVFDYLDRQEEEYILIGDFHSAYTLLAYSYDVDYILLNPNLNKQTIDQAIQIDGVLTENYFNIPIIIQNSPTYENLITNEKIVIVIRDEHRLASPINLISEEGFISPIIFTNSP